MICKPYDVVEVPFPFIDSPKSKSRKALVISAESFNRNNKATVLEYDHISEAFKVAQ